MNPNSWLSLPVGRIDVWTRGWFLAAGVVLTGVVIGGILYSRGIHYSYFRRKARLNLLSTVLLLGGPFFLILAAFAFQPEIKAVFGRVAKFIGAAWVGAMLCWFGINFDRLSFPTQAHRSGGVGPAPGEAGGVTFNYPHPYVNPFLYIMSGLGVKTLLDIFADKAFQTKLDLLLFCAVLILYLVGERLLCGKDLVTYLRFESDRVLINERGILGKTIEIRQAEIEKVVVPRWDRWVYLKRPDGRDYKVKLGRNRATDEAAQMIKGQFEIFASTRSIRE